MMRFSVRSLFASVLLGFAVLVTCARADDRPGVAAGPHLALVIGVSRYVQAPLPTAGNDAGLMARALSQAGFTVTAAADVDHARFDAVVQDFLATVKASGPGATIVVYVAGYGLQYTGDVYLAPLNASLARDVDVPDEAVSLSAMAQAIDAIPAKARLLIYDIARENPFARRGARLASGLPWITPGAGTIIATNAAPGTVATPDIMPYGFYARALAEAISTPGIPVSLLLERARLRTTMLTNGATIPWNAGSLPLATSLGPGPVPPLAAQAPTAPLGSEGGTSVDAAYVAAIAQDTLDGYLAFLKAHPVEPLAARMRTIAAVRREALLWGESRRLDSDRAYWTYLRRYPRGPHMADARRRLMGLHAALEPPPRFDIVTYADAPPPPPSELPLIDQPFVTLDDAAWPAVPPMGSTLPIAAYAFYEALPPPPLVTAGRMPIAEPIANMPRGTSPIVQPVVPSGPSITTQTSFTANGDSLVTTLAEGTEIEKTATTTQPKGGRSSVQTEPNGTVMSRVTVESDKGVTTVVQTGPSGGILSRSITRPDASGGRMSVETNGRGQIVATLTIDAHGMATVTRGFVSAAEQMLTLAPFKAGERRTLLPPAPVSSPAPSDVTARDGVPPSIDPPMPAPLAMPASALPPPVVAAPQPSPNPAKPNETTPSQTKPAIMEAAPLSKPDAKADPAAALPLLAPMPPRRAMVPAVTPRLQKAGTAKRRLAPVGRSRRPMARAPRRRR